VRPWSQEEIDTEVATYSDNWESPMDIVDRLRSFQPLVNVGQNEKEAMRKAADEIEWLRAENVRMALDGTQRINAQAIEKKMAHISLRHLLRDMTAQPGNASWVGMKLMDQYCGKPTNYAATTIFRAMVEAYAAEHSITLVDLHDRETALANDVNDDCALGRISRPDVTGGVE
jgi:hypothetical protein